MIRNLKEYFSFSRREKRSLFLVLIILFITISYRIWIGNRVSPDIIISDEQRQEIELFISSFEKKAIENQRSETGVINTKKEIIPEYFQFDPNLAEKRELLQLGISEFVAANIIKYREAGGTFIEAEDLLRIYGMEDDLFKKLESYINLPDNTIDLKDEEKEIKNVGLVTEKEKEGKLKVEINTAGFSDLMKIKGMQPAIAGRIVNYRELVGGFYSFTQLEEVYGMSDTIKSILEPAIIIDTMLITKLSLNSSSFSDLLRHPYLDKKQVNMIFELKNYYKDSFRFEHIIKNKILPESTLNRIMPYFRQ